jgi:hypothetical protein
MISYTNFSRGACGNDEQAPGRSTISYHAPEASAPQAINLFSQGKTVSMAAFHLSIAPSVNNAGKRQRAHCVGERIGKRGPGCDYGSTRVTLVAGGQWYGKGCCESGWSGAWKGKELCGESVSAYWLFHCCAGCWHVKRRELPWLPVSLFPI